MAIETDFISLARNILLSCFTYMINKYKKCHYWCLYHGFFVFSSIRNTCCTSGHIQQEYSCLSLWMCVFVYSSISSSNPFFCSHSAFLMHFKVFSEIYWQYFIIKRIPNGCIKWLNKITKSNNLFCQSCFIFVCMSRFSKKNKKSFTFALIFKLCTLKL